MNPGATARPEPGAAQSRSEPARPELCRPAHHRPHHLPAYLRGSRHRKVRSAHGPAQRRPHLRRLCELFQLPTTATTPGCSTSKRKRARLNPRRATLGLNIDDKPLKEIIRNLYYPDSPYEFSVLSADILGPGLRAIPGQGHPSNAGHRAVVEDKPEVKKAGGVYYTPTYIVDYIVKNTVGRLVTPLTPPVNGGKIFPSLFTGRVRVGLPPLVTGKHEGMINSSVTLPSNRYPN